jgi:hypothetical protein
MAMFWNMKKWMRHLLKKIRFEKPPFICFETQETDQIVVGNADPKLLDAL